ncbi:hypothetical protein, partial [Gracilinema caldarium]|uniref:hypothetical protein n=1 Tax=Gracilinema caldarium TaxID=215591 RepID=UPI0026EDD223
QVGVSRHWPAPASADRGWRALASASEVWGRARVGACWHQRALTRASAAGPRGVRASRDLVREAAFGYYAEDDANLF